MRRLFFIISSLYLMCVHAGPVVGSGSGCLVSSNLVLTAYHVVNGARKISIAVNGESTSAKVREYDKKLDWALLETKRVFDSYARTVNDECRIGEKIYLLGFPTTEILGQSIKYSSGAISALNGIAGNDDFYQISAPIQPGCSGAPLFNEHGLLIGVVTATMDPAAFIKFTNGAVPQNLNFALKANRIRCEATIGCSSASNVSVEDNQKSICLISVISGFDVPVFNSNVICQDSVATNRHETSVSYATKQFVDKCDALYNSYINSLRYILYFNPRICFLPDKNDWGPVQTVNDFDQQLSLLKSYVCQLDQIDYNIQSFFYDKHVKYRTSDRFKDANDFRTHMYSYDADILIPACFFVNTMAFYQEKTMALLIDYANARSRLSNYYILKHNHDTLPILPSSFLGIKLGCDYTTNDDYDSGMLKRIRNKFFKKEVCPLSNQDGNGLRFEFCKIPNEKSFMGSSWLALYKIDNHIVGILTYIEATESFNDDNCCTLFKVVKSIEKKYDIKMNASAMEVKYNHDGKKDYRKWHVLPIRVPLHSKANENKYFSDNTCFDKRFVYWYESGGRRITVRTIPAVDGHSLIEMEYYMSDWENVTWELNESLRNKEKSAVEKKNHSVTIDQVDVDVL